MSKDPHSRWEKVNTNTWASLVAQCQRICLHWQEIWVLALDQEDPLQKEMATHSSIFELEIPWTEESSGLQFMGLQKSQVKATKQHTHIHRFGDLLNSLVASENKQRPG